MKSKSNNPTTKFLLFLFLSLQVTISQAQTPQFKQDEENNPIITESFAQYIAEEFKFKSLNEEDISISDLKGKIVILDFWQTWCSPCLASFRGFQKAKEKWPDKIEIIAASPDWADSRRKIRRFIKKHDYNFNFVLAYELEKELKLSSIPYKIIIAPNGTLIKSVSDSKGADGEFKEIETLIKTWFSENKS